MAGCFSRAGIVNVLQCARAEAPRTPVYGVIGGLHLAGMDENLTQQTVEAMREFQLRRPAVNRDSR
jgi:7,8-dihydropterin-6-yl-methyl-4-(beta-D-ribofuranosyl)aminobenzene 5'-phosphate synthase